MSTCYSVKKNYHNVYDKKDSCFDEPYKEEYHKEEYYKDDFPKDDYQKDDHPKFDFPKDDIPKCDFPKCDFPKCHFPEDKCCKEEYCYCKPVCACQFKKILLSALGNAKEIERNINTLYENDPILVTNPLDPELLRLTQRILIQIGIELGDLRRLFNPKDFICDGDLTYTTLLNASFEIPVIESVLANINALKSSTDKSKLCQAEQNFVLVLTSADLLLGSLLEISAAYRCIDNCC